MATKNIQINFGLLGCSRTPDPPGRVAAAPKPPAEGFVGHVTHPAHQAPLTKTKVAPWTMNKFIYRRSPAVVPG